MPEGISLLEMLEQAAAQKTLTKDEFGRIMHDPNASDEEIQEALNLLNDAGGYENLGD